MASDKRPRLESPAGDKVERLAADGRGMVEGRAQGDVAVVNAIGIERDVGAHGASAEEVYRAALAHQFDRFLPSLWNTHGFNGNIDPPAAAESERGFQLMALRMLVVCTT